MDVVYSIVNRFRNNANAATLAVIALVLLCIGIFSPFMKMKVPLMGVDNTYSLVGGICEFFKSGNYLFGIILLAFSVLFPIFKLLLLLIITNRNIPMSKTIRIKIHHLVELLAKYSMLDVFVIAIIIVIFKVANMVSVASVAGAIGIYIFCAAIFLSILAGIAVDITVFERMNNDN